MDQNEHPPNAERAQTDESLRVERERADDALADELAGVDETADRVVERARARADELLAAARARTDGNHRTGPSRPPEALTRERLLEDEVLKAERAKADEILRAERAEHVALLLTERQETDKDLLSERARADDAIATRETFMGVVSHDLRNMLNTMMGFAGLIAERVSDLGHEDDVRAHAQRIVRAGARMNRLVGDLVDVASIEAGALAVHREMFDPGQVVIEAVDTFQSQALASKIELTTNAVGGASSASFDPARILQVLANLIGNGIKFSPNGGKVEVSVNAQEGELLFSVSDTGSGMAADQLEAIFERFLQINKRDRRGAGLGLYISKCIVLGHGGRIWAESKVGEGSTFFFTLPGERSTP